MHKWTKFPTGKTPRANTHAGKVYKGIRKCRYRYINIFIIKKELRTCTYHTRVKEIKLVKQASVKSNSINENTSKYQSHKKELLPKIPEKLTLAKMKNNII